MATLYLKTAGGNWSAAGTWSTTSASGVDNSGPPTAATNVILELASGSLTIDGTSGSPSLCRSVDCSAGTGSYTGTITAGSTSVLNVGDATAGTGNVALNLPTGFTFAPNAASLITLKSTSATQQTILVGTYTLGNLTVNGSGNSYLINSNITMGGTFTYTAGTTFDTTTGSRIITLSGAGATFAGAGKTYYELDLSGSGTAIVTGTNTFTNLNRTGTAIKTDILQINANQTITGTLTLNGNSAINRLYVVGAVNPGSPINLTVSGATVTTNNADYRDITFVRSDAGDLDLTNSGANLIGDCGGNTRTGGTAVVTFTAASTQTSTGTASFTWSTHGWTTRVPLPQDDVTISNVFISARIVTLDMPRLGHTIDATGATWAGTSVQLNSSGLNTIYGSFLLPSGTQNANNSFTFEGRSGSLANGTSSSMPVNGWQIQTGGSSRAATIFQGVGGIYQFLDAFSTSGNITVNNGTLDANGFSVSLVALVSTGSNTRAITLGSGTWTLSGTGNVWNFSAASNLTLTSTGSTIVFTSNTGKNCFFNNYTYNNVTFTGDNSVIKDSNTFTGTLFIGKANKTTGLLLTNSTTQTFSSTGTLGTDSDSSNKALFLSNSGSINATVTKPSGSLVSVDFLQMTRIAATQTSFWYAGANSVDNGNNTNWVFTAPPAGETITLDKWYIRFIDSFIVKNEVISYFKGVQTKWQEVTAFLQITLRLKIVLQYLKHKLLLRRPYVLKSMI